jgi:ribosomal-protein-alanine N-acetyltransferase
VAVAIEFLRLTEVPLPAIVTLLNEPRNSRHMPLSGTFSIRSAADWVRGKDGQWETHGYGPWAVVVNGEFAGWGGFQFEQNGAVFALVLMPRHWGHGAEITRAAMDREFTDLGLDEGIIALPHTRDPTRVVARFGFAPDGDVSYDGAAFRQFRLTRDAWAKLSKAVIGDRQADCSSPGHGTVRRGRASGIATASSRISPAINGSPSNAHSP